VGTFYGFALHGASARLPGDDDVRWFMATGRDDEAPSRSHGFADCHLREFVRDLAERGTVLVVVVEVLLERHAVAIPIQQKGRIHLRRRPPLADIEPRALG
jgi:hypothetical protein